MITLHESTITSFPLDNGIGVLSDAINAYAEEELNGLFEFEMEYDSEGHLVDELRQERIIKAFAQDKLGYQLFRIYSITKNHESDSLIVRAQHITYDLADNFVEEVRANGLTKKQVMELISSKAVDPHPFNVTSTNDTTTSSTNLFRTNPLQMIAGMQGSVLQIWGGQIERDNFDLIMHDRRGHDDGVEVTYEKNITGLEANFDISNLVTRIFPFYFKEATDEEPEKLITVNGKYVDSPLINDYSKIYNRPIDYSQDDRINDDWSDAQIKNKLTELANNYFTETDNDKPKAELNVHFQHLWETEEYKDVAPLELVGMGDTVTINHSKLNVQATSIVNYIKYNCLTDMNEDVQLGNVKARFSDSINKIDEIEKKVDEAESNANQAIVSANGKNTTYYGPDEPTGNIKVGDLWFKIVDGEYTKTYRFDGIQWQLIVDFESYEAKVEAEKAKDRAEEAYDNANNATQNAMDAIDKAQQGFDTAQNALASSNSALSQSADAYDKSLEAFDKAQESLDEIGSLEIGGRNLLPTTRALYSIDSYQNYKFQESEGSYILSVKDNNNEIDMTGIYIVATSQWNPNGSPNTKWIMRNGNEVERLHKGEKELFFSIYPNNEETFNKVFERYKIKIERGDIVTDWSPAPEDIDQKIKVVADDLDGLSVIVDNNKDDITSIQATAQGLQTQVTNIDGDLSSVTQLANALQRRVTDAEGNITSVTQTAGAMQERLENAEGDINTVTQLAKGTQQTVSNLQGDFTQVSTTVDGLQSEVGKKVDNTTYNSKMTQLDNAISQRVTKTDANNLYTQKTEFNQFADGFEQRVESLEGDVTTGFSAITQTVDSIDKRVQDAEGNVGALQTTATSLAGRLTDAEGNLTTLTSTVQGLQTSVSNVQGDLSQVTQLANAHQTKISNMEDDITTLTQTATSLTARIDNIGNRNYLKNSDFSDDMSGWLRTIQSYINYNVRDVSTDFRQAMTPNAQELRIEKSAGEAYLSQDLQSIPKGTEKITVSFYVYQSISASGYIRAYLKINDDVFVGSSTQVTTTKGRLIRFTHTYDVSNHDIDEVRLQLNLSDYVGTLWIQAVSLFTGDVPLDWSPSPDDAYSQYSQLQNAINLRVQKGDVINQINLDTSGVLISGKKLILDGDTTVTGNFRVRDANIASVDAGKMTTGTLNAAQVSIINLNANNIRSGVLRSIEIDGVNITGGKITQQRNSHKVELSDGEVRSYQSGQLAMKWGGWAQEFYNTDGSLIGAIEPTKFVGDDYYGLGINVEQDFLSIGHIRGGIRRPVLRTQDKDGVRRTVIAGMYDARDNRDKNTELFLASNSRYALPFQEPDIDRVRQASILIRNRPVEDNGNSITAYVGGYGNFKTDQHFEIRANRGESTSVRIAYFSRESVEFLPAYETESTFTTNMVRVSQYGQLQNTSSSRRFKLDEKVIDLDYARRILNLDAKSWDDKKTFEKTGERIQAAGLIAEDTHDAGLELFVSYDKENRPHGLSANLWTLLIPIVKNHEGTIQAQQKTIESLVLKVAQLEQRINKLECAA